MPPIPQVEITAVTIESLLSMLVWGGAAAIAALAGAVGVMWRSVKTRMDMCEEAREKQDEVIRTLYVQLASRGVIERRRSLDDLTGMEDNDFDP